MTYDASLLTTTFIPRTTFTYAYLTNVDSFRFFNFAPAGTPPDLDDNVDIKGHLINASVVVIDKKLVLTGYGYLLDLSGTKVFHPGDSLTVPGEPIDLLLTPVSAPWLKVGEAIDFVREVAAPRNLAIHDRVYTEVALGMVETHMTNLALADGMSYTRLADGTDLDW